ncbi:Growth arrest/ DNA-damage-inducible protein-interacting protein 1 [Trinorchestia longiramus]|nr:Growth arrest/ DNA-damage-inducible protein-interacting protein 1 [Trinorchestia longiramus]
MQALKLSRVFSYVGKLKRLNRLTHTSCIHLDEASATQQHSTDDEEAASLAAAELKKLEKMQDKSRLQVEHYKIFHRIPEPMNAVEQDVSSVREVRARYGRDGDASEVDLRYLWPSKQEMYYMKEFEKVVNPLRLPDMVTEAQREKAEAVTFAIKRQV